MLCVFISLSIRTNGGAQQLLAQYGGRLVCERYRYDEHNKKRFKTVELIVEEKTWTRPTDRWQADSLVPVRVTMAEVALTSRSSGREANGIPTVGSGKSGTTKS